MRVRQIPTQIPVNPDFRNSEIDPKRIDFAASLPIISLEAKNAAQIQKFFLQRCSTFKLQKETEK